MASTKDSEETASIDDKPTLSGLPADILYNIVSRISLRDRLSCTLVCKYLSAVSRSPQSGPITFYLGERQPKTPNFKKEKTGKKTSIASSNANSEGDKDTPNDGVAILGSAVRVWAGCLNSVVAQGPFLDRTDPSVIGSALAMAPKLTLFTVVMDDSLLPYDCEHHYFVPILETIGPNIRRLTLSRRFPVTHPGCYVYPALHLCPNLEYVKLDFPPMPHNPGSRFFKHLYGNRVFTQKEIESMYRCRVQALSPAEMGTALNNMTEFHGRGIVLSRGALMLPNLRKVVLTDIEAWELGKIAEGAPKLRHFELRLSNNLRNRSLDGLESCPELERVSIVAAEGDQEWNYGRDPKLLYLERFQPIASVKSFHCEYVCDDGRALRDMTKIESLRLHVEIGEGEEGVFPISTITTLTHFALVQSVWADREMTSLQPLGRLQHLEIEGRSMDSIVFDTLTPLCSHEHLTRLDLRRVTIGSLQALPTLPAVVSVTLEEVYGDFTLDPLADCAGVTNITLRDFPPTKLLSALPPKLKVANIQAVRSLVSAAIFSDLVHLKDVFIGDCPLVDIGGFARCSKMKNLTLTKLPIKSTEALSGLRRLRKVSIKECGSLATLGTIQWCATIWCDVELIGCSKLTDVSALPDWLPRTVLGCGM